jgi:hypothetical protein
MFGIEYRQNKECPCQQEFIDCADKTVGESLKSKGFKDEILKFICVHLLY